MKTVKFAFILSAVLMITACRASDKQAVNEKPDIEAVIQGNNEFALELYAKLRTSEGNLFFSPYSISTALAMVFAGARTDTEKQIAETLHFTLPQKHLHLAFQSLQACLWRFALDLIEPRERCGYQ